MKRLFLTAAVVAAMLAPAFAQKAPGPAPMGVPDSKLTINDCLLILQGLERLDEKRSVTVNKGKSNESITQDYYEFRVGTQLDIARNIAVLNNIKRDVQPVQQRIFYQILKTVPPVPAPPPAKPDAPLVPATSIQPGTPQEEEFNSKMLELTGKPCLAQLARISSAEIDLEKNRIPLSVLSLIDKILDR